MSQHNAQAEAITDVIPSTNNLPNELIADGQMQQSIQQTTVLTASGTMTITSSTVPLTPQNVIETGENKIIISPVAPSQEILSEGKLIEDNIQLVQQILNFVFFSSKI